MPPSPSRRDAAVRARALAVRQFRAPGNDPQDDLGDEFDEGFDDGNADPAGGAAAPGGVGEWSRRLADRTPPGLRAVRVRVGPRAVAGAVLVCVLVAAGLGFAAWRSWPDPAVQRGDTLPGRTAPVAVGTALATAPPVGGATSTSGRTVTASSASVVVHVAGRVQRPGVVTLSAGSRAPTHSRQRAVPQPTPTSTP